MVCALRNSYIEKPTQSRGRWRKHKIQKFLTLPGHLGLSTIIKKGFKVIRKRILSNSECEQWMCEKKKRYSVATFTISNSNIFERHERKYF